MKRKRTTKPILIRSTSSITNYAIIKKSHKRIKKLKHKDDFMTTKQGIKIFIDRSVR